MARQEKVLPKKRGRPATGKGTQVVVRCQPDLLRTLDAWIKKQPDKVTRPEAIRRLLAKALDHG